MKLKFAAYFLISFPLTFCMFTSFGQKNKFGTYFNQRLSLFEILPDTKGEIIFLGNSITDGGEWCELFGSSKVKNRGISGDVTEGVLFRLNEVTRSRPRMVFLLIGINDLSKGIPKDSVFSNICAIAEKIRFDSPKTQVFVHSILPVNDSFGLFKNHTNKTAEVIWINDQLKSWCSKEHFYYIDLFDQFKSSDSNLLNPLFTNDGLHLTGDGYLHWVQLLKPFLKK